MTLIVDHSHSRSASHGLLRRAADLGFSAFSTIARVVAREIDRRRTMQLLECEDRMLADIGISRGDVYASLLTSAGEKASEHLSRTRWSRREAERAQAREARFAARGA
jgi:uncharacterized protein YjiS (DUF1127 family)